MIRELMAVGFGGAAGSIVRYLLSGGILAGQTLLGFPAGTFTVNAAGSLLIGILLEASVSETLGWLSSWDSAEASPPFRPFRPTRCACCGPDVTMRRRFMWR